MSSNKTNYFASKLAKAFLKGNIIAPIPKRFSKKLINANNFRKLCESKIKKPIIGFKAGGTAIPVLKKLKEKEPFYASVFKQNFLKNNKSVRLNKYILGIELEVCYLIKKDFFGYKKKLTKDNIKQFITHIAPCLEIVGYRQRKKGIKTLGDLSSDFGANVKFIIGSKKKFENIKIDNLKTRITQNRLNKIVHGNTNTVYISPLNSLKFVLNKLIKDKVSLNNSFYVFTGSTVGVVPILGKGIYTGKIDKLGTVRTKIT